MIGHGEADHPPAGEVDHGGQIQPALPGAHVADVAAPGGVDRVGSGAKSRCIRSAAIGLRQGLGVVPLTRGHPPRYDDAPSDG